VPPFAGIPPDIYMLSKIKNPIVHNTMNPEIIPKENIFTVDKPHNGDGHFAALFVSDIKKNKLIITI